MAVFFLNLLYSPNIKSFVAFVVQQVLIVYITLKNNNIVHILFGSEGKDQKSLILSDLYYHMQGEYEGRKLEHKLFKELFQFLLESKFLESYKTKDVSNLSIYAKDVLLFDCTRLEKDLGIDLWDMSELKDLKTVAQTMLTHMKEVNSMLLLSNCKLSALKALTTMLPLYDEDVSSQF